MAILIIIIVVLSVCYIYKDIQIKNITRQLSEDDLVTVSFFGKSIEKLGEAINRKIKKLNREKIDIKNRDEELKQSISHISHDFRTPLAGVLGYITLLETCSEEEKDNYISIIKRKAEELNGLVKNFYELSILDNRDSPLTITAVDITEIITDVVISNYTLIKRSNMTLINRLPSRSILVRGDYDACTRIVQNLLSNGVKHGKEFVEISVLEHGDTVVFTTENDTMGFAEVDLEKLFQRFYTSDYSRGTGGTGLGLYIVKLLVEKMNGSVSAEIPDNDRLRIHTTFICSGNESSIKDI